MPAADEGPLGWLERALDEAPDPANDELRGDVRALGLAGTIAVLAATDPPDPAVAREAPGRVQAELAQALGADGELGALLRQYADRKGARGRDLARRLVGRTLHELYDLQAHALGTEDVLRALDLVIRGRGERDARDLARALARFSRPAARVVLGHLEEQMQLVHRLATEELMPSELDRPILQFAPRIFARRLPSIVKLLLPQEPRLRLTVVLWGRFRGLTLSKQSLVHALDKLVPEKPISLVRALAEPAVAERRRAFAKAEAHATEARLLEEAGEDLTSLA